jgi:serine/threonine protein kinase
MNGNASTAHHEPGGDDARPDGATPASPGTGAGPRPGDRRLGDFEVLRELGRGGMGVVYEARQVSLNRKVALKVLGGGWGLTPKAVQRFRREAEAAARLHHTNIVPVYTTGEHDGVHFYAMELIDGPSLDRVIRRMSAEAGTAGPSPAAPKEEGGHSPTGPNLPGVSAPGPTSGPSSSSLGSGSGYFDTAARMIAEVADALEYAHREGVLHRDIKPSNLLLSPAGRLSVNDFGLARMLEQPGMTMTGEFVGTPAYMSPEQIAAGRTPLDHRSDIYSLGATLYELLTFQPPFSGDQRVQVLAQILHKEPRAPRKLNARVPADLETICLKALEKDPDRRYQSAGAMAEDLRRHVNRFAISARRAGPWTRLTKWVKRHPGMAASLGCLLVTAVVAAFFAVQARRAQDSLRAEQRQAAVENAILEAMSGDSRAALQAVAAAETQGAEPGRLNLLRGVVEYYRGRPREAVVYLELAQRQLPRSVAVKATLVRAYLDDGRLERSGEATMALGQLEAKSPEDHLFLALSLAEQAPGRGLQILDGAPARLRQSPVARLVRGIVRTWAAMMTGEAEDAEQALDDLRKVDLPDSPLLLSYRVRAQQLAALAYGPDDPRRAQAWSQADRDVERLARHRDNRIAVQERCWYYFVRGDEEALLAAARQARQDRIEDTWVTELEASVLYGRKEFDEAARVMEAGTYAEDQTFPIVQRGLVLAAIPGRRHEAERLMVDAIRACRGGAVLSCGPAYLQLLGPGYDAKTREIAREARARAAHLIPNYRDGWYHDLLAFQCGSMDEATLLKRAGENRCNQCEAHCYIGLRRLAEGNRSGARACFRRVLNTPVFLYDEFIWSRAFLARIDDPAWMPWVPADEHESKP